MVQKHSHIHPIARHTLRVSNHREPSGWIDSNDFCRNEHVCFRVRQGTCVDYTTGDVAYEWGAYWVKAGPTDRRAVTAVQIIFQVAHYFLDAA